jgi:hypothetical protein
MGDGDKSKRRVVTGRKRSDGSATPLVQEVTHDGYVATWWKGADEPVLLDPIAVSRVIQNMRELQAMALQGIRWPC